MYALREERNKTNGNFLKLGVGEYNGNKNEGIVYLIIVISFNTQIIHDIL